MDEEYRTMDNNETEPFREEAAYGQIPEEAAAFTDNGMQEAENVSEYTEEAAAAAAPVSAMLSENEDTAEEELSDEELAEREEAERKERAVKRREEKKERKAQLEQQKEMVFRLEIAALGSVILAIVLHILMM